MCIRDSYRHDYGSVIDNTQNNGNTIIYQTGVSNEAKLYETNHYVVTSEYKVYKCLDNSNDSASTVEPSSTSQSPFILGDGYTWKYMYTVNASDFEKFKSDEYIPVPEISEVTNRINSTGNYGGAIYKIDIKTSGSGYSTGDVFNVIGDGVNAQVRVTTVDATNGGITGVKVINPGTSYTYGQIDSALVVTAQNTEQSGTGTGATLTPIISPGPNLPFLTIFFSSISTIPVSDPAHNILSLVIVYLIGRKPFLSVATMAHSLSVAAIAAGPSHGSIVLFKKLNNCK